MNTEEIKARIAELLPGVSFEEGGEWVNVLVDAAQWPAAAALLKADISLHLDYLFCLTCVDWKTHLTMVYHLSSTHSRHSIVFKSKLDRERPEIGTVSFIWRTAEFLEREVFEMFGVRFLGHPDLRLLILPDGWEGKFPMRKDFEDPVNMIKL
jgi:NADH-quinone oxidoreductase subunit C